MATDVDGVYLGWGQPGQRKLGQVTPEELAGYQFAAGSMGPKVEAAARFAAKTGQRAAIGSLDDIAGIVAGKAGTNVIPRRRLRDSPGPSMRQKKAQRRWTRPRWPVRRQSEKKYLTVRQAAFIGVGAMVGAGIFALLGAAGEVAGAGGVAVVPDRRGHRGIAGLFVRETGRPLPVGRGAA